MDSLALKAEVRLTVAGCCRALSPGTDGADAVAALRTLLSYLDEGAESATSPAQRAEFRRSHYTRTVQLLVHNMQADWLHGITAGQRAELWDGLFLRGPPEQALLVLMEAMANLRWIVVKDGNDSCSWFCPVIRRRCCLPFCRPSAHLDRLVLVTEKFLQSGRLGDLLWSYCQAAPSESPQLRETLLGRIVALPDLAANKLHPNVKPIFLPQQYYPLLASELLSALDRTCQALRGEGPSAFRDEEKFPRVSVSAWRAASLFVCLVWQMAQTVL